MSKPIFGIPVKTRVPLKAWVLAALVALCSLIASALHLHTTPNQSVLETSASELEFLTGS